MARYPQGISTFIPQIQPYQVDFNFVNNVLQSKQNQYDQNWKQLNKLYGQIYYADLTHDESKAKQKAIVNEIDFNLKRVAGLDLSLDQNVQAAQQVFQPFYQDTNLMKDMAWTKNTKAQLNTAEALRTSSEEDRRGQYWKTGVDAINYKMQEFQETPYDQIQSIGNVKYSTYVDVMKKAEEITKEYGDRVTPSYDDGKWIVKTTNGEQLIGPLSDLLQARMGNDPFIKEMYQTQAYVQRKNYMNSEASRFGGDKAAAERDYLQQGFEKLKDKTIYQNQTLKDRSAYLDEQLAKFEKAKEENPNDSRIDKAIRENRFNKDIVEEHLAKSNELVSYYTAGKSNGTTSTGYEDPFSDINSLRYKVDNLEAADLFDRDASTAAQIYAYRNYKEEKEVNPYGLARVKHEYRMAEKRYEKTQERKLEFDKLKYATGDFRLDENYNLTPRDELFSVQAETQDMPGITTGGQMARGVRAMEDDFVREDVMPDLNGMLSIIAQSGMDKEAIGEYFQGRDIDELVKSTQSLEDFDSSMEGKNKANEINKLVQGIESFFTNDSNNLALNEKYKNQKETLNNIYNQYSSLKVNSLALKQQNDWDKKAMRDMAQQAANDNAQEAFYLIDQKDGSTRTVEEHANAMYNAGIITSNVRDEYIKNGGEVISSSPKYVKFQAPNLFTPFVGDVTDFLGITDSAGDTVVYDTLKDKAGNDLISYKESVEKINSYIPDYDKIGIPPMLSGKINQGTGDITNIKQNAITLKGKGASYGKTGQQVFNNINNIDFDGTNSYMSSYNAFANLDELKKDNSEAYAANQVTKAQYRALISMVQSELQNPESETEFKLTSSAIAARDPNKQSITIRPLDIKFWEQFKANKDNPDNVLSAAQVAQLQKNGLTLVSDRANWNNELTSNVTKDPLLQVLENTGDEKSSSYTDVNIYDNRYTTTYDYNKVTGLVSMTRIYRGLDGETLTEKSQTYIEPMSPVSNLTERLRILNDANTIATQNQAVDESLSIIQMYRNSGYSDAEIQQMLQQ